MLTGSIFLVLWLLHLSFLDLRHRQRGGIAWFWLENPAPAAIWLSRLAIATAAIVALATLAFPPSRSLVLLMLALLLVHFALVEAWDRLRSGDGEPPR